MNFEEVYKHSEIILTEGAIVERLKSEFQVEMNRWINHAGLIYTNPQILEKIYRQYIEIGLKYDIPIMIMSPTRKVNFESQNRTFFKSRNIFADSYEFLYRIRNSYQRYSEKIFIGAMLGCKGDAYSPIKVLETDNAYLFHRNQIVQINECDYDFLYAGIMPEINEALGMAMSMAESNIPYIISFMMRRDGCLIDGTTLSNAVELIDKKVLKKPLSYMTNCIHPSNLIAGIEIEKNNAILLDRFNGIQANASILSPEELNNCGKLQKDDVTKMINDMIILKKEFKFKIFGGCCGTDNNFLNSLAQCLVELKESN